MRLALVFSVVAATAPLAWPAEDPLAKMDQVAAAFRSLSAKVKRLQHTAVINDDSAEAGSILMKRSKPGELHLLSEITEPDSKAFAFHGRKAELYFPKIQTVQEFDVGNNRGLVEQFLLLGFGASRQELERDYTVKLGGPEMIGAQKTTRLELVPKSEAVLRHIRKVELWISEATGYPVRQKFYQSGGDYQLVTYSEMKINPNLPDSALKLKLPRNVKREYPQKQ